MGFLQLSVVSLALLATCSGYSCPDDEGRIFHADVESECQTYHLCENSRMVTFTCPSGQAFDHQTNECQEKSVVQCIETAPSHLHKRSIEDVHSVSVEFLKSSTKELLETIKSLSKNAFQETLPTVYDRIEKEFVPLTESFKQEIESFFYQQALPKLKSFYAYSKRMEKRIFKKVYRSYELSNSTHLNVVSFDDEMEQILVDLKPIIKLVKFYATIVMRNSRAKREVGATIPENHQSNAEVLSIDKEHLKNTIEEIVKTVKTLVEGNLQKMFPSTYQRIHKEYLPFIQSLKNSMESKFKQEVLSALLKIHARGKIIGDKIVKKVYQSYELSNSTHLNVVSFDDVLDEIFTEIKPFVNFEKLFSVIQLKSLRVRRDVIENHSKEIAEVHSVSIEHLKDCTKELLKEIKNLSENALKEIFPVMYDTTVLKSLKSDLEPIFKKVIIPQLAHYQGYAKRIGNKIVKKVYKSYEVSNSTHINIVSFDDVMDELINNKEFQSVGTYFSSKLMKNLRVKREVGSLVIAHRNRRSVDDIHTFSIQTLKNTSKELSKAIKAVSKKTFQDILPSLYDHIENNYAPIAESFRQNLESFFKKQVLPSLQKVQAYSKRMGDKIFKKAYRTYELSNSTHLNIVSFDDVMDEIFYDVKPLLERYIATEIMKSSRSKRDVGVPVSQIPELLLGQIEPLLNDLYQNFTRIVSEDQNTLTSRVIVPTLRDMMNDPETSNDIQKIFWSSKAAFAPLMVDVLNRQSYYESDGTIVRIPREKINEAKAFFYRETKPIITKMAEKHLPEFLARCSKNTQLIFAAYDQLRSSASKVSVNDLRDDIVRFYRKYYAAFKSSSSGQISTYTLSEFNKDLKPIEVGVLEAALDFVDNMDNSWLKVLFGRNSPLFRSTFGERETYAVPKGSFSNSGVQSTNRGSASYAVPRRSFQNSGRSTAMRRRFTSFAG